MNFAANLVMRLIATLIRLSSPAMRDETGQSQLDYELLVGFLIVVAFVTLTRFGAQVHALAVTITSAL
jgi:hypothetical protein